MLAALVAALALAQTPPAEEPLPPDMVPVEPARPVPETPPASQPGKAEPGAPVAAPQEVRPRRQLSLLSAEPLGGGSATLAWAGWSSLGVSWAQGISDRDDLGASADFDWARTELRLGGFYRRPLGKAGAFDMAGRLGVSWLANFGGQWIFDENHHDRGLEVAPSLVLSARGGNGIFSLSGDVPIAVTWKHDSGFLFIPRLSAAYETPLYDELTVGVRAGVAYRAGSGDAPLGEGGGELQLLVLLGYQVL
jgi:hypothetical protein